MSANVIQLNSDEPLFWPVLASILSLFPLISMLILDKKGMY